MDEKFRLLYTAHQSCLLRNPTRICSRFNVCHHVYAGLGDDYMMTGHLNIRPHLHVDDPQLQAAVRMLQWTTSSRVSRRTFIILWVEYNQTDCSSAQTRPSSNGALSPDIFDSFRLTRSGFDPRLFYRHLRSVIPASS
jgi:hypothetical protein